MTTSAAEWNGSDNGLFELQINAKSDACGEKFVFKTIRVSSSVKPKLNGIIQYIFRWCCDHYFPSPCLRIWYMALSESLSDFEFGVCVCQNLLLSFSFGQMTYESEFVGKLVHRLANKLDQDHVVSNLKQVDQKSIKSHKSRGYCNNKTHHLAWMTKTHFETYRRSDNR